eukprot:10169876-Alexandrium_andersonii.AAC.1
MELASHILPRATLGRGAGGVERAGQPELELEQGPVKPNAGLVLDLGLIGSDGLGGDGPEATIGVAKQDEREIGP